MILSSRPYEQEEALEQAPELGMALEQASRIIVCGEAPVNSTFGLVPALDFPCLLYQYCTWLGGYT